MSSIFESQRNFGPRQLFSKSVRSPISPPTRSFHRTEDPSRSKNPSPDEPNRSDQREDLNWIAAAQVIGAARAQMIQQNHQVTDFLNYKFGFLFVQSTIN